MKAFWHWLIGVGVIAAGLKPRHERLKLRQVFRADHVPSGKRGGAVYEFRWKLSKKERV